MVYLVTMSSDELKLFSEFLEKQKIFNNLTEDERSEDYRRARRMFLSNESSTKSDKKTFRMSERYLNEKRKLIDDNHKKLETLAQQPGTDEKEYFKLSEGTRDLYNDSNIMRWQERKLRDSGYDDKYSSRLMEGVFRNKLDASDAKEILNKREALSGRYSKEDPKKGLDKLGQNFKRKFNDASVVYEAGTDGRSLGRDTALAAGGLVAAGLAINALKNRRQEKKRIEDRISNKYRT